MTEEKRHRLSEYGYDPDRPRPLEYIVTEATNQWTGAAFEALGGVRVHIRPFLTEPAVPKSDGLLEDVTTSPNGFLADKDSGGMFYVVSLA